MSYSQRSVMTSVVLLIIATGVGHAAGMGMEEFGPAGEQISRSPEWPKGVENVLRHASRVYWRDVNGSENAYYDGDLATVNELLALYASIEMAEHSVVILPGKRQAASFDRKLTPYTVEFVVPGSMEVHFRQFDGGARLYPQVPTLIVALDAKLAKQLDELKVPRNVTLRTSAIDLKDALAVVQSSGANPRTRRSAMMILAESGDSSAAVTETLKRAAADKEPAIRAAGEQALERMAAGEPVDPALQQRVQEFVSNHAQRVRVPSPQDLLEALKKADAEYAKGFTARGTRIEPVAPNRLIAWTVTMGRDRLVVEQRDVENTDYPSAPGRYEYTVYVGPERMGTIYRNRLWIDGKLSDAKPWVSFEPVGSTYDLLIGRYLWPLGRGFSRRIDRVTEVQQHVDGRLYVTAEAGDGILVNRWEMRVDPRENFLVNEAKGFSRDEKTPAYTVETVGVLSGGGRSVAHTARWFEGASEPASIAVTSVSGEADEQLIQQTEKLLDELPGIGE